MYSCDSVKNGKNKKEKSIANSLTKITFLDSNFVTFPSYLQVKYNVCVVQHYYMKNFFSLFINNGLSKMSSLV